MADLTPDESARVRRAMRAWLEERPGRRGNELAKYLGRTQPVVSNILSGKSGASYETARRLAHLVHQHVDDLLGRTGDEPAVMWRDRYPSRGDMVRLARVYGVPEPAIARVLAVDLGDQDPGLFFWARALESSASRAEPEPPAARPGRRT